MKGLGDEFVEVGNDEGKYFVGTLSGVLAFGSEVFDKLGDFLGERGSMLMGMFFGVLLLLHFIGLDGTYQLIERCSMLLNAF